MAASTTRKLGAYRHAIMRAIDPKVATHALTSRPHARETLCPTRAKTQHHALGELLKYCGMTVHTLPSGGFPDSVFIEDTAVVLGDTVLITRPGAESRRLETLAVKEFFKQSFPEMKVITMNEGTLDGGDVMFTGTELFVGLTSRTDDVGIAQLRAAFPTVPIRKFHMDDLMEGVKLPDGHAPLHLKSFCSMVGPDKILVGGDAGANLADRTPYKYKLLHVPEMEAANVIYANGVVIRRRDKDIPYSARVFKAEGVKPSILRQVTVAAGELAKVDGALTCCALLF